MNKKYAFFGVAAVVAIAGVIYFGTGANQQASVANITSKSKAVPAPTPTFPTGDLPADVQAKLMTAVSVLKSASTETSPSGEKKHYWVQENEGWCVVGHGNTIDYVFQC